MCTDDVVFTTQPPQVALCVWIWGLQINCKQVGKSADTESANDEDLLYFSDGYKATLSQETFDSKHAHYLNLKHLEWP